ncbi:MAG TPA: amino acid adenylation domain-containing protein [Polyangiaceae bacterium]|nr:amino acid adenylation domain-containing protein [Polyangiaceae bacterium]
MANPPEDRAPGVEERALQLPTDFSKTPASERRLASHAFEIRVPDLGGALAPDALLVAAFGVSLHRYNGQAAIPLGAARLGAPGHAPWARSLCLATGADATLRALAAQAGEALRGAAGEGGARAANGAGGGAAITWVEAAGGGDGFDALGAVEGAPPEVRGVDLHLVVAGSGEARRAAFVYDASLFRPASVERFAGHLGVLLGAAAAHADAPVARLPLLTPAERCWLESVSEGPSRPPPPEPLHRLVERNAAATPDAVAVRYRDQSLTYAELNRRANRLARYLQAEGAGAERPVAVCVEPSFDIAVALLAVLKAGAIYVPVDPTYPPTRIRDILSDTTPKAVLSRRHLVEKLDLGEFGPIALDDEEALAGELGGDDLGLEVGPGQTAYIYYTSGTTGKPKGVMASHANLATYIHVARGRYGFGPGDVMPAIARFSFSISMFELMLPLAAGGTLVVLDRDHVLDPARMASTLAGVTFFHAGPSLLKHLLPFIKRQHASFEAFAGVRHASSGGDLIAPELLESLKEVFPRAEVFVIYGCSEISCMGCTYPVPRDRAVTRTYVGRPFDNVAVRVLDAARNPVPAGVVGEIHFAGGGVVKGYLNRPDLTAEKFVEIEGRRFYRTGDVGRLSDDGWVEVLGRNDFQVKIRGMRIELGEVEYALRRAPGVRDGVVVAKGTADGEKALVAYVVLGRGEGAASEAERRATLAALRRHMAESLPDYMVPASYVELASLPLNHNMKVDRRALPEPERAGEPDPAARAPETATERRLAEIWAGLLGVARVGLDDNFFELGGHSMLAMDFIARVERDAGVALEGMEVLRESLEVLASICDARSGKKARKAASSAPPPSAEGPVVPFHFGPGQGLYGVLHASPVPGLREAALVCAPVGEEHVRARFVLTRLARRLAAGGVPTLLFDYYGFGDSLGESGEASCARWQRDIADAHRELARRTGAARVAAVGVRLGAALLCNAAPGLDLARIVLWDPVCDGAGHYAEMAALHAQYLRSMQHLRLGRPPARPPGGGEELLGATYSREALRELKALAIPKLAPDRGPPVRWLATSQPARQRARFASLCGDRPDCRLEALDFDCSWDDLARFEDVLPDVGIAAALAAMVKGPA